MPPKGKYSNNGSDHQHVSKGSMQDAHNTDDHKGREGAERPSTSPNKIAISRDKSTVRLAYLDKFNVVPTPQQLIEYGKELGYNTEGW